MAASNPTPGARGWPFHVLLGGGVGLIFVYVSFVPHRYLFITDAGAAAALSAFPSLVSLALVGALALRLGSRGWSSSGSERAIAIQFVILVIGAIGASSPALAVSRTVYYFVTGTLLCLVLRHAFRRVEDLRMFLITLSSVATLVAAYGIFEFWTDSNPLWGSHFVFENPRYNQFAMHDAVLFGDRIRATVGHPVYAGAYLLLLLPVGLTLAWQQHGSWRILGLLGAALSASALFLTFSRGAWISGLAVALWYTRRRSLRSAALAVVLLVAVSAATVGPTRIVEITKRRVTTEEFLGQRNRFQAYRQVAGMVLDRPLFGIGTAHYRRLGYRYRDYDDTPDNVYLRTLGENGITGFCALVMLLGVVVRQIREGERALAELGMQREKQLCTAIVAGVAAFLLDMVTCDGLYFPLTRIAFWTVAGCGLALAQFGSDLLAQRNPRAVC